MSCSYRVDCPECEGKATVTETSGSVMEQCDNCEYRNQRGMTR